MKIKETNTKGQGLILLEGTEEEQKNILRFTENLRDDIQTCRRRAAKCMATFGVTCISDCDFKTSV